MKRIILTLAFAAMIIALKAQSGSTIAQPGEFVARRINASGEVTLEYAAEFTYSPEGKLLGFNFPDFLLNGTYIYEDNYLRHEVFTHHDGYDYQQSEVWSFVYENGRISRIFHAPVFDGNEYWLYYYNAEGRLQRKEYGDSPTTIWDIWDYEYDCSNGFTSKTENHFHKQTQASDPTLKATSIYIYDETYTLLSVSTDTYNNDGEITSSVKTEYGYDLNGLLVSETSMELNNDAWFNTDILSYVRDDAGRIVEQQKGPWSDESGDWNITQKIVYEFSEENATCTVSLLKKVDGEWTWDLYNNQKLFFEPELQEQQRALTFFMYEILHGSPRVSQFEFHMIQTERPTYMKVGEDSAPACAVYPNPGNGKVRIEAPAEDCVVRFYDLNGRLVLTQPFDFATEVATDHWTPGLYLWEIWNGTQRQASGKWVKE